MCLKDGLRALSKRAGQDAAHAVNIRSRDSEARDSSDGVGPGIEHANARFFEFSYGVCRAARDVEIHNICLNHAWVNDNAID